MEGPFHVFGVRHHGPGSARSLLRALQDLQPDCVLIEGPPEADDLLFLAGQPEMRPPVALLLAAKNAPGQASFYPLASFSPEWLAIRYALEAKVPVRFMDLPYEVSLAQRMEEEVAAKAQAETAEQAAAEATEPSTKARPGDPLAHLATLSGYDDPEAWWDAMVEGRGADDTATFAAIADAMQALRDESPPQEDLHEQRREAFMRKTMRAAEKDGFTRIAVVCGAWHVPALLGAKKLKVKDDNALLKGLPKAEVTVTWTPWTYANLARSSGYRAGVESPGFYELLATGHEEIATRWLITVARLLRKKDLDVSSAHVIEAVRLARNLASLRGRALPGLTELTEAVRTVLLFGEDAALRLIHDQLVIGVRLGSVPKEAPAPPIQRDLEAQQKRLRLPVTAGNTELALDLRKPLHLERSHLLHRLRLLNIPFGVAAEGGPRSKGTFAERWELRWEPEFAVRLSEVSVLGSTVEEAAARHAIEQAKEAPDLGALAALLNDVLLADLAPAVAHVASALEARAASGSDVGAFMEALPPLVQNARYGSVRDTDKKLLDQILDVLVVRIVAGLDMACQSLNAESAAAMLARLNRTEVQLLTLADAQKLEAWREALQRVATQERVAPLLSGRVHRILYDAKALAKDEVARRMHRTLSPGTATSDAAAWVEGFLFASGLVLVHDRNLFELVDAWLTGLDEQRFQEALPLLRRTFATFPAAERRNIGVQVRRTPAGALTPQVATTFAATDDQGFDHDRAQVVLPLLKRLLRGDSHER